MKITIDIDESELSNLGWSWPPIELPKQDNKTNHEMIQPVIREGSYYWNKQKHDNGWVDGIDRCANCPNNPLNPNGSNYGGFCYCTISNMYGPNRITF